jgi:hypothetical protein
MLCSLRRIWTIAQNAANEAAPPRTSANEWRSSIAPVAAPIKIIAIDPTFLDQRMLSPPATNESNASPVTIRVRTVVVRSGTASLRTVPLRTPIPKPVRTMTLSTVEAGIGWLRENQTTQNAKVMKIASIANDANSQTFRRFHTSLLSICPARAPPARADSSAMADQVIECPGTPAKANAIKTTLPVILAVRT